MTDGRAYWVSMLDRLARPVLGALAEGRLRRDMPRAMGAPYAPAREAFMPIEALARVLAGIAPWLELEPGASDAEGLARRGLRDLALRALDGAFDPDSPDRLDFTVGEQCLVDASFLALGLLRAPTALLDALSDATRTRLRDALRVTRMHVPYYSNHLLFAALVEAMLGRLGGDADRMRVDYALRQHDRWYVGDGFYRDGEHFHCDYYQSFVIHPYLLALADLCDGAATDATRAWGALFARARARARRQGLIQARQIAPDGSFPVVGRSIAYRCGAFHLLADLARRHELPPQVSPAAARCALTATIRRTLEAPGTFDPQGWLRLGLAGHQPALAERYINTGSLYLCSLALLPLGLPATDPFWSAPDEPLPWTRIWSGADVAADKAMDGDPVPYGGNGWSP